MFPVQPGDLSTGEQSVVSVHKPSAELADRTNSFSLSLIRRNSEEITLSGYTCVPSLILPNSRKESGDNGTDPGHFSISGLLLTEEWFLLLFAVLSTMLFSCFYNLTTLLLIENDFVEPFVG